MSAPAERSRHVTRAEQIAWARVQVKVARRHHTIYARRHAAGGPIAPVARAEQSLRRAEAVLATLERSPAQ